MLLIDVDRWFPCCCNQCRLIKLLSSIADTDADVDAPAVAADRSTAVVAAIKPEQ